MTGRIARVNSAAVFISLLFWGWLWGAWGCCSAFRSAFVKVVSQHVEQLHPMAELLGDWFGGEAVAVVKARISRWRIATAGRTGNEASVAIRR